ncbi:acetate/propionate family kinase [Frigoribacterium sp. CG_9.8]|uniref:acetate/propionate family kinase n=1 Tax=Frigoribacterium sp. CG_9.8 TaxID=2787733 RepID=UPI0018CA6D0C|nr:acetate kinase [Frigoribacterium sp. CG_9.8]MBG6106513.1 acetate kinase [Frigoribacterium sp. CG_9.8]
MTQIFVVNSGSSSIKYQLIDVETEEVALSGLIERIGEPGSGTADHEAGMRQVLEKLGSATQIVAVGHRVVHGGSTFDRATLVTAEVESQIDELSALAPLHNPANLQGIRAARKALADVPHVAVFDTAFHQTLPAAAYTYAIDAGLAEKYRVRRYGFHGTSHKYVSEQAAIFLDRPLSELKTIVLHLGNGASVAAIDGGVSVETSMGMTPLEGLVMGTRSGDVDPAVLIHLHREAGLGFDELDTLLNRKSGLLGLTGSGDMRDVQDAASRGDATAEAALAVYRHRVRRYIGAYIAHLGGLDALVFTAGVGENNVLLRRRTLAGLEFLGISVDPDRNELVSRAARFISPHGSPVAVLVIPTNEELEIARQVYALVRFPRPGVNFAAS